MSTSYKLALIDEYASISRALASPHRLRLLEQLAQGEKGVDALAEGTALTFANCSQHLQELRRVGLVTSRREGKAVIYRLTDDDTLRLMALIQKIARNNIARVDEILDGIAGGIERPEPVSREVLAERLAAGDVVGSFEVLRRIGVGGISEVWAVRHLRSGGRVGLDQQRAHRPERAEHLVSREGQEGQGGGDGFHMHP